MKLKLSILFLFIFFTSISIHPVKGQDIYVDNKSWEYQLNEMNYLVIRASSINIIYGLYLTRKQAEELKALAKKIESLKLPVPDTKGNTFAGFVDIRKTYVTLIEYLKKQKPIPDSLKNQVLKMRILEAEIIKRTLLGAQKPGYKRKNCMECHAPPDYFPKGDISNKETKAISKKERKEIDLAHVKGLFQEEGTNKLWELKSDVDNILTNGQKYMLKSFRCCLLPPSNLSDPTNIGQAFVTDEWIEYFMEIRKLPEEYWKDYKQLFIIPIEDIIEATLPGIKQKYKKEILKKVDMIIEESRKMDRIDFELQKESLCLRLKDELNVDFLIGETDREKEERQFIAAMFLLFFGSPDIYDEVIKQTEPVKSE